MPKRANYVPENGTFDDSAGLKMYRTIPRHRQGKVTYSIVVTTACPGATIDVRMTHNGTISVIDRLVAPVVNTVLKCAVPIYLGDSDTLDIFVSTAGAGTGKYDGAFSVEETDEIDPYAGNPNRG